MVKVLGKVRAAGGELAYKVLAKGYMFEVAMAGKKFRIRQVPGGVAKMPYGAACGAFDEVAKFLGMRCAQLAGAA